MTIDETRSMLVEARQAAGLLPIEDLPAVFGRYTLLEQIGVGGMGVVFKAVHSALKQTVALKTIRKRDASHEEFAISRFYREIEAAGAVIHPNVARATDAGVESGVHFLVTEFIDGTDLKRLVDLVGPLPLGAACHLLRQIADGLGAIAAGGMVHRDIKPSNILSTWQGQAKIVDLGLARLVNVERSADQLTGTGMLLGTLDFLAPEQAQNAHNVDIRADIYSLGCTLVWLLTGRPLFGAPEFESAAAKIRAHCDVLPDLEGLRGLDRRLLEILELMLAKDPDSRFQSPSEVAAALQPLAIDTEVVSILNRARNRMTVGVSAGSIETVTHKTHATVRPKRHSPAKRPIAWLGAGGLFLAILVLAMLVMNQFNSGHKPPPESKESQVTDRMSSVRNEVARRSAIDMATSAELRDLDAVAPLQWLYLLEREPSEFIWNSGDEISRWQYDRALQQATASCDGLGLLEMGTTKSTKYVVQLGVLQNRWKGGVGLYFGGHSGIYDGRNVIRYQYLQILESRVRGQSVFMITRNMGIEPIVRGDDAAFTGLHESVATSTLDDVNGEQVLEVTVADDRLRSVKVNGVEHPKLVQPEINQRFTSEDYSGSFGAWVKFSDGTFRNARFMIIDKAK